jgi:hypothetical protein
VAERGCWRDTTSAQDMSTSSSRAQAPASSDKVSYTMHRSSGRRPTRSYVSSTSTFKKTTSARPGRRRYRRTYRIGAARPPRSVVSALNCSPRHQLPRRGLLPGRRPERLQLAKLIRGSDVLTKSKHLSDSRSRPYDATGWLPVRASSESPSPSRACPHPDLDRSCAGSRLRRSEA